MEAWLTEQHGQGTWYFEDYENNPANVAIQWFHYEMFGTSEYFFRIAKDAMLFYLRWA